MPDVVSKVLAFSEKGVHLDVFNKNEVPIPCVQCKLTREWVAYSTSTQLVIQSTDTTEKYTHDIPNIKTIEGIVGTTVVVITKDKVMHVLQKGKTLYKTDRVKSAVVSEEYVAYSQEIEEACAEKDLSKAIVDEKSLFCESGNTVEQKAEEVEDEKTAKIAEAAALSENKEGDSPQKKKPGKNAYPLKKEPVVLKIQKKQGLSTAGIKKAAPRYLKVYSIVEKRLIPEIQMSSPLLYAITNKCLISIKLYKGSRGEIEIIRMADGKKLGVQIVYNMITASIFIDTKYNQERAICLCSLNSKNDTYYDTKALYYLDTEKGTFKSLPGVCNPITDIAFLKKNEVAVCYDNSPSKIGIYNGKAEKVKILKEGIRNKMFFSRQENIACFAGMNNLPGNMELFEYPSEIPLSINEEVGCSVIDWSPEGRYYIVGTTSKMSIDNKISLLDYYSQKIGEVHFKELKGCIFSGKDVPFSPVENPPAKIKMKKSTEYIPPSMRTGSAKEDAGWVAPYIIKDKAKAKENRIKCIQKELLEIERIEKLMASGTVVPGGILKIQKKEALLNRLKKKQG